uniref:Replication protein VP4 n=1 Tax=Gokushovirinae environmental samples TaxID=1478972 RepID=A0A2R3UAI0_9VIRU|nr:replication protein VP4 [Gokushovirinae environmental samples]
MSRKPGIANEWFEQYQSDVYKRETSYVLVRGHKIQPPRYYDKLHERAYPDHMENIKFNRQMAAHEHWRDHTPARLHVAETVQQRKTLSLARKLI